MSNKKQFKSRIFFRVDGSRELGLGHVVRAINLAKELRKTLSPEILFFFKKNKLVEKMLKKSKFNYIALNNSRDPSKELSICSKKDVFITDSPILSSLYLNKVKDKAGLLLSVYYSGKRMIYPVDIIVDPNLKRSKIDIAAGTKYYGGGRFAILGDEFVKLGGKKKVISPRVKKVLVCFGGSDPNDITLRVLKMLKTNEYSNLKIFIVAGPGYSGNERLKKEINGFRNITLLKAAPNLARLIKGMDLAILSGGILMHESSVLGVPSMIICHNSEQNTEAMAFHRHRIVYNLGLHNKVSDRRLKSIFDRLLKSAPMRKRLSKNANKYIDAYGVKRIAEIIKFRIKKMAEKP